ncbi:uncharacterized protein RJT20DRAFT_128864 [Scheffersomyces xylosifermentans]|uniref:uncharacterized protein n=1 Tax=Scheffersomyces xylosifermentans TaxID=1304137 RepID=UPI00315D2F61
MCIKGRRLVPTETFLECTNDDISRRIMAIFQPIELHLNDYELFKLRPKIRECLSSSRITFYTSRSITATPKLDYIIEKIVIADPILRYTGYTEIDYMNEVAAMKYFKKNKFRVPGIRRYGRFNAFHIVDFQAYSKYFPHLVAFDCSDIPIPWERYRELPKQLKSLTIQLITPASPVDDKIVSEFPSGLQELKLLSDNWNPCKSTIDLGNLKELQKQNLIFTNARVDYPSCIQEIQISLKIYPGSDQFRFLRFDQLINNLHYHVHLRILHLHIFCSYSSHSGYLGLENECFTGTNVTLPTHLMELSIVGDYHFKFTTEIQLPSNLVTLKLSQVKIGNLTEYKFPQNLKLLELSSIVHDISVDETEVFYGTNLLSSLTAFWHKRKRSQRA